MKPSNKLMEYLQVREIKKKGAKKTTGTTKVPSIKAETVVENPVT